MIKDSKIKYDYKKLTPFKWFVLENFPFIEADFDALTNWQLFCKLGKEINKIIDSQNLVGKQVETLTSTLENLDIQDEVNKKLDDMAKSGELEEIITNYINLKSVLCFDNVSEMKKATNLSDGSFAKTLGYYSINDGGSGFYKIRTITTNDSINEGNLIRINDSLVAELICNNKIVNVKQFGAVGDGIKDDTKSIQNAFNYFKINDDTLNQNSGSFYNNNPKAGGKVVFTKSNYVISSTIVVQNYVDIDFNSSKIIASENGVFANDFMFSINSPNSTAWILAYPSNRHFIINGQLYGNSKGVKGLYMCDGRKIENMAFTNLKQSIYYPFNVNGILMYIDQIAIINCYCSNPFDDELYQFQKLSEGDGIRIIDCHFPTSADRKDPINAIYLARTLNGEINDCLNGKFYINFSDISINNWHCELGQLNIYNSKVAVNNSTIFQRKSDLIPITIHDGNYPYSSNQDVMQVILNATNIVYYYSVSDFDFKTYDIDTSESNGFLKINNSYREIRTKGIAERSLCGLCLKLNSTGTNYIYNIFDSAYFENGFLYSTERVSNSSNFSSGQMGNVSVANVKLDWKINTGTYYYKIIVFSDVSRLLGATNCPEKNISISSTGVKITMDLSKISHNIIRIYRGTSTSTYTQYVDIPNPKNLHIFDNGYSCNGYIWQNNTSNSIPNIESCRGGQYVLNKNDNVINFFAEVISIHPNQQGNFKTNDELIRVNATAGNPRIAYCIAGGTPGTWVNSANLQES